MIVVVVWDFGINDDCGDFHVTVQIIKCACDKLYGRLGSYDTLSMILNPPKITIEYTVIIKMLALNENDLHHS